MYIFRNHPVDHESRRHVKQSRCFGLNLVIKFYLAQNMEAIFHFTSNQFNFHLKLLLQLFTLFSISYHRLLKMLNTIDLGVSLKNSQEKKEILTFQNWSPNSNVGVQGLV